LLPGFDFLRYALAAAKSRRSRQVDQVDAKHADQPITARQDLPRVERTIVNCASPFVVYRMGARSEPRINLRTRGVAR
jgi:hypothetical protein